MNISTQTQAVLLLTAWFTRPERGEPRPLTPSEWGRFALWLKERGTAPDILLKNPDPARSLHGWSDRSVTTDRIAHLLGRAGALGLALEKWQRAGLWVMTRSDPDYPARLKKRLKFDAPPVLFGCGNRQLLDRGGIAVVGSRDATDTDLGFTTQLGREIASQGESVVSGGARGVDEAAMLGALDHEGTVIGIFADSLLRAATSAKYRDGLMSKNLVLASPFSPEAGFDVGNAMARNKYIYCLADAAVVVATSKGKGGTWTGALENLRAKWVPLWVKAHADAGSGSAALVEQGARWLPELPSHIADLFAVVAKPGKPAPVDLFDSPTADIFASGVKEADIEPSYVASEPKHGECSECLTAAELVTDVQPRELSSLYEYFLVKVASETRDEPLTEDALRGRLDLNKSQLNAWLKRATAEGKLKKLNRPVRYQIATIVQGTLNL